MKQYYDVIVVGGGPAGMAAAYSAREHGVEDVLILERGSCLGGVLPQCIHDGFGVYEFGQSMTGPEYAVRWKHMIERNGITCLLDTMVTEIKPCGASDRRQPAEEEAAAGKARRLESAPEHETEPADAGPDGMNCGFLLVISSLTEGTVTLYAKSLIMATGCRERTAGQLRIPGGRPAGIMTAGTAQYMMNVKNYMPGKSALILGTGDVGLIMARRLTLEGMEVRMIVGERASGLMRNYVQCVSDYGIPLRFGWTVSKIAGRKRMTGAMIKKTDKAGRPVGRGQYIHCDTLIVAAGLIPERDVFGDLDVPGAFFCGNVYKSYDTVDAVTVSGRNAGTAAAQWLVENAARTGGVPVRVQVDEIEADALNESRRLMPEDEIILARNLVSGGSRYVYCTVCPKGCRIEAPGGDAGKLTGYGCENGRSFAQQELKAPMRIVTSTVKVTGAGSAVLLPVKTDARVPKDMVSSVMEVCRHTTVTLHSSGAHGVRVRCGDMIVENLFESGVNLISCGEID